jgi:hypothetical protein
LREGIGEAIVDRILDEKARRRNADLSGIAKYWRS